MFSETIDYYHWVDIYGGLLDVLMLDIYRSK